MNKGISERAEEMEFSLYGCEDDTLVEGMLQLQYTGRNIKHTDNDWTES